MSGSEGVRFDSKKAQSVSASCWEKRQNVTAARENISLYYNHLADLWVGDAADVYRRAMVEAIKALDKVDQAYWDMLKLFDMDREKLEAADKEANAVAAAIEPAVWAEVDGPK